MTTQQKARAMAGEGAYIFFPEIEKGGFSYVYQYSQLDPNVDYHQGENLDQYTIMFHNAST